MSDDAAETADTASKPASDPSAGNGSGSAPAAASGLTSPVPQPGSGDPEGDEGDGAQEDLPPGYPAEWEADVVLSDGGTCHLRPIKPSDADALQAMHLAQSPRSIYLRYFAPMPRLSERDLRRFTHVDYVDRVALVGIVQDRIIGVGRYDVSAPGEAEVAFNIADSYQGRGLGSVLLEHLAAVARERDIVRFVAEVLPENRRMVGVFRDAGYEVTHRFDDGVISLHFPIKQTEKSLAVMASREQHAEAASLRALMTADTVAVIGASTQPGSIGNIIVRNILAEGYTGRVYPVHPTATEICGIPAVAKISDIDEQIDLAVIALPTEAVENAAVSCGNAGVRGILVITDGFSDIGPAGEAREARLLKRCRAAGMRLLGPASLGLVVTDPATRLNASVMPLKLTEDGGLALFSQSGGLGLVLLAEAMHHGLGLSAFVSVGNRADISTNDLLQYWEEDERTRVVAMYTESSGNPRKFFRIARHVTKSKPVVLVRTWAGGPASRRTHGRASQAPREAYDALLRQAGVIRADDIHDMIDVVTVLANQPLPAGMRVAIMSNSAVLDTITREAAENWNLDPSHSALVPGVDAQRWRSAMAEVLQRTDVDSLVLNLVPPLGGFDVEILRTIGEVAADFDKTTVACVVGHRVLGEHLVRLGEVPAFSTPEGAVRALAAAANYAYWRNRDHGVLVDPPGCEPVKAREIVDRILAVSRHPAGVQLGIEQTRDLLSCYGIHLVTAERAVTRDEVVEAAERLGYPVALKYADQVLRERRDISGARLGIDDEASLRRDIEEMLDLDDPDVAKGFIVQPMVGAGISVAIHSMEDQLFGPIISFGLTGDAIELLGDVGYRIPPLTDVDVRDLVRSVDASPRLFGYRGTPEMNVNALEDLIARVSRMADDLPELAELDLRPVLVTQTSVEPLWARIRLADPQSRVDSVRRL